MSPTRSRFWEKKAITAITAQMRARPGLPRGLKWLVFFLGLILFVGVQTGFLAGVIWGRAMLPEVDDSYAYLVKTAEMEQCFFQNCRALEDLREQLPKQPLNPEMEWQKLCLEGRIFVVYHPLLSAVLLGLKQVVPDLATAYKVLWTAGPTFFGLAFGYLLLVLWGPGAAGIALLLLSTKVFPSNGIHYVVPSNLAMGIGLIVFARVIARKGNAPWSLTIGCLLMILMHPLGRVFALIGIVLSLLSAERPRSKKAILPVLISALMVVAAFVVPWFVERPLLTLGPDPNQGGWQLPHEFAKSVATVMIEIVRFNSVLFGSLWLFVGAAVYGYLALGAADRVPVRLVLVVFMVFLSASLWYVAPVHPADAFLRLWIPFLVVLFGAIGNAVWQSARQALNVMRSSDEATVSANGPANSWQVVVFAVLATFSFEMVLLGAEGFAATIDYMKNRQPLFLDPAQPKVLMDRGAPGDRVVYDNVMVIMPFYFVHGAMSLGAVYYPILEGPLDREKWLGRRDVRFAVAYNPIVSLPGFQNSREEKWWISSPELRFSPLSKPRKSSQVGKEGKISAESLKYLEISVDGKSSDEVLRIFIEQNGDNASWIRVTPVDDAGHSRDSSSKKVRIPERWSGWIDTGMRAGEGDRCLRIDFHSGSEFLIGGLKFGENGRNWPWAQRAQLTLIPRIGDTAPIVISFKPEELLPQPLNTRKIAVLDDRGCTVLFEIGSRE